MIIPIFGKPGSGKTNLIKEKILDNFEKGKSSVYLNFEKAENIFSSEFLKNAIIINVNSFSQISKLKDINSKIIILNFSKIDSQNSKLYMNLIKNIFKNIFDNNFLNDHEIFIDNYDFVFFKLFNILSKRRNSIYITIQNLNYLNIEEIEPEEFDMIFL